MWLIDEEGTYLGHRGSSDEQPSTFHLDQGRLIEADVTFCWEILEGGGALENSDGEIVTFAAPDDPTLTKIRVTDH